jgi:hypothetical protein
MNTRRNCDAVPPRTVGSYPSYSEAEAAVDYLSNKDFPVQYSTIVADGLQFVENVTGRLNWLKATGKGLLHGALIGALIGFFFGLFDVMRPILSGFVVAGYGAAFGASAGAIFGLVGYLMMGGKRDFESRSGFRAKYYDLVIDEQYADQAMEVLRKRDAPEPEPRQIKDLREARERMPMQRPATSH